MGKDKESFRQSSGKRVLCISGLVCLFLTTGLAQAPARSTVHNATATVTVTFSNATLRDVIWELQKQTDFTFVYSTPDVKDVKVSKVDVVNEDVYKVLDRCLRNTNLTYTVHGGVVAIRHTNESGSTSATQQRKMIQGKVYDETGETVPGANILIKGTVQGTTTDMDGNFALEVEDGKNITLVVSFVGYSPKEVRVTGNSPLKIVLESEDMQLEEVVVTGYGTFKKSAYAGSASTVKTSEVKDVPAVSFSQVLQGAAPGVQISSSSGQPGAAASINIRGMGSFNASNSPLYVIDGVPVTSGDISSTGSDAGIDVMSTINTSDIENITVIKDAAAASLYGSRAANGVILITTKQGKTGKPAVSLKADWGFSDFAMDFREVMGGEERRNLIYDGLIADGMVHKKMTEAEAREYADGEIDSYAPKPWCGYIDWDDVLFQKGSHQTYEASITGGTDKFKYYSSLGYLKQDGVALNSGLERITGRVNVDYQASKRFSLGVKALFANVNQDVNDEGTSYTSPFYTSKSAVTPSDPVYNEDGSWNRELIRIADRNPLLSAVYDYRREHITRAFNTVYAQYEFIDNLRLKSTLSYDYTLSKGDRWYDPRTSNGDDLGGDMKKVFYEYRKLVWENALSYQTTIADNHHVDALVGYETDMFERDHLSGESSNFARYDRNDVENGMKLEGVGGYARAYRLVSYLTRVNYDYRNKYYLGGSYRLDGSSRLSSENRWGSFWSVSGAWRAIEEDFLNDAKDWLSDLKLRASYGVNGTLPSDYYGYMGLSSIKEGYLEEPGILQSQLENKDLSWETNYNFNVGVDFGIFNRLNVTLEYYTRQTKNLLMDRPVSMTTGFDKFLMNIGEVKNHGVELEIRSTNITNKNFSWNTTFNLGHNKNEIVRLDGIQTEIVSGSQIRKVGMPYRTFYLIEFAGINPETGAPQFYTNKENADGSLDKTVTEDPSEAYRIATKHADPVVQGGLSNTLSYKGFDLNFMLSYQFGGYSYDNWAQKTEHGGDDPEGNIPVYYRDRWQNPGDNTDIERFILNGDISMKSYATTRRLHSTNFIRLKNLTFGYSLPKAWTSKVGIDKVRLYVSGNNLLTWAKYDYYDPEAVSAGTAIWGTPPLRSVTFGLNVNF